MADFDDYFAFYEKGAYREAYAILRNIMKHESRWSKVGDMYLRCADLELLINDDLNRARQFLNKALKLGCSDMSFYYNTLGYVLWRVGERDRGKQYLEKSIELEPSISNLTPLGRILSHEDDKDAIKIWHRILEKEPNHCLAYVYLGIEAVKSGDRAKAFDMAKRAESLSPTIRNFYDIGRLYYDLEQYQNALDMFLKADRGHYEPKGSLYSDIAACYCSLGDNDTAIGYASRAIDLNFDDDYAKSILLQCMEKEETCNILNSFVQAHNDTCLVAILHAQEATREKKFSEAQTLLSKAKQLGPSSLEMYYIGRQYHFMQCFDKALDVYLGAKKMGYDKGGRLFTDIAGCYSNIQETHEAIQYACKAIDLDVDDEYAKDILLSITEEKGTCEILDSFLEEHHNTCLVVMLLAQGAAKEKNVSEVKVLLSEAEQLEPSPVEKYYIGRLYDLLECKEKALDRYLEAEKLGYASESLLYSSIAWCYFSLDDYDASIQYALKALVVDPDDEYAKDVLFTSRKEAWGSDFGDNY